MQNQNITRAPVAPTTITPRRRPETWRVIAFPKLTDEPEDVFVQPQTARELFRFLFDYYRENQSEFYFSVSVIAATFFLIFFILPAVFG